MEVDALEKVYGETLRCNRCGFCQSCCPVYRATGIESSCARGHNAHVRAVIEGKMELVAELKAPIFECLLCRACTANCFPAVETDRAIVAAREAYIQRYGQPRLQRYVFRALLQDRDKMDRAVRLALLGRRIGISLALSLFGWFSPRLARAERMTDGMPGSFLREILGNHQQADIKWGHDVAYFLGCGFNYILPEVGLATLRVLSAMGLSVRLLDNLCCGLPPYSYGDIEAARLLARRNIDLMVGMKERWVVTECASCSSFLKTYGALLADESEYASKAAELEGKLMDFTELTYKMGSAGHPKASNVVVSYHDPCHLSRHQGIVREPRVMLAALPGVELREMEEADWCCGGAGVYTILHPQRSDRVLARKMENFARTGARLLVTSCPACMVQLRYGMKRRGVNAGVVHLSQMLFKGGG